MKILVHTIFYRPEWTGVAKYTTEMCEWLAARGHDVHVVAPPPYYPQWAVQRPYSQWRYHAETLGTVHVHRCPIWLPRRPAGLGRVLYSLSYALASLPVMLWRALCRPHLVVAIEPSILSAPAAWIAARMAGATAWLHIQDFETDLAYELGQVRRGRGLAMLAESCLLRRFDVVSSISKRMIGRVQEKGVEARRLHVLPNWVDTEAIRPTPQSEMLRAELGLPEDRSIALFSGSLGPKQGVETIIESARIVKHERKLIFLICGDGPAKASLEALAAGLENVRFLPLQPPERLNELLSLADCHLLPQHPGIAGCLLPSKLISILASGRPVIAACGSGSDVADIISGCGILIEPGNSRAMAHAVLDLAADRALRSRLGAQARQRALDHFRRDTILTAFEQEIHRRIGCAAHPVPNGLAVE